MIQAQFALRKFASPEKALSSANFFKTGPGEYGEGDIFIGITVPEIRTIAKEFSSLSFPNLSKLLQSKIHEDRLLGLIILVEQFKKTKEPKRQEEILQFYLSHKKQINNWDLVDTSATTIIGQSCLKKNNTLLMKNLVESPSHWDRRIGIVACLAWNRAKRPEITFKLAQKLLNDPEDLMHKATGWMLREAGKVNPQELRRFIQLHGKSMPRTMLRYSIEKWPEELRKKTLLVTKT